MFYIKVRVYKYEHCSSCNFTHKKERWALLRDSIGNPIEFTTEAKARKYVDIYSFNLPSYIGSPFRIFES